MDTFLTVLTTVAVIIFGKIIYDKYITNKIENEIKVNNHEDIEKDDYFKENEVSGLTKRPNLREQDKSESLSRMAKNMGCKIFDVRKNYIKELREQGLTPLIADEALGLLKEKKIEEAKVYNIHPDDTSSALMEKWTKEFFENKEYRDRKRTQQDIIEDYITENPKLEKILQSGDVSKVNKFFADNPDLLDSVKDSLSFVNKEPSRIYWEKAYKKSLDKEYFEAILLINKGLKFNDAKSESNLYLLRAECQLELSNYNDALNDTDKFIKSLSILSSDDYYSVGYGLQLRSRIKQRMGNEFGAIQDFEQAGKYYKKAENEDGDLPF